MHKVGTGTVLKRGFRVKKMFDEIAAWAIVTIPFVKSTGYESSGNRLVAHQRSQSTAIQLMAFI
jgi:hypothetical protein